MEWIEFAGKIKLSEELQEKIKEAALPKEVYLELSKQYQKDHECFFKAVLNREDPPMCFLYMYCKMACETFEHYRREGMDESIFWETFQDIRFWCDNYYREYGTYGLGAYDWFWRLLDMTLFRLGRLQFEQTQLEYEVKSEDITLSRGMAVMNIHIPQGEPLTLDTCVASLEKAYQMFGKDVPYVCHSWLLYPGLLEVLSPNSNIFQFGKLFRILEIDYKEREAEWRIFGKVQKDICNYESRTSLQKRAKEYLLSGKTFGNGFAILKEMERKTDGTAW